jgi:hypothetical protein
MLSFEEGAAQEKQGRINQFKHLRGLKCQAKWLESNTTEKKGKSKIFPLQA